MRKTDNLGIYVYVVCVETMNDMSRVSEVLGAFTTLEQAVAVYRSVIKAWKKQEKDTFEDAIIERSDSKKEGYSFEAYLEGYACDWSRNVWIESCKLNHDYFNETEEQKHKCSHCGSENVNIVTSVNQLTNDVNYKYLHCEECGEDTELE